MRAGSRLIGSLLLLLLASCRSEVSQPDLQRPLESLPQGACMIVVASDLANTWERAKAHEAASILRQAFPSDGAMGSPSLTRFLERLQDFEARTGTQVHQDLVLNALGGRMVLGVYPSTPAVRGSQMLMVAELAKPEKFSEVLVGLRNESLENIRFADVTVDGKSAVRVSDDDGLDIVVLQHERMLIVSTHENLASRSMTLQEQGTEDSAIRETQFTDALEALGLHSVVMVNLGADDERIPWAAQGFTWDRRGLHFKRLVRAAPSDEPTIFHDDSPVRRDELLRSVPHGMTMAYYARPTDTTLLSDLFGTLGTCYEGRSSRAADPSALRFATQPREPLSLSVAPAPSAALQVDLAAAPLGLSKLPFNLEKDVLPWSGDEMTLVLAELVSTPLVPMPSMALLIEVSDAETASRTLYDLERPFSHLPFGGTTEGFLDVSYGGKTYRSFAQPLLDAVAPSYLIDGDVAVITTTRALMQSIIDTRRVGRHHLLSDSAFAPFDEFVPDQASAVVYTDQRRLQRVLEQIAELPKLWGEDYARGVEFIDGLSALFDHFPSSAVYLERTDDALTMSGWMLEKD